MFKELEGATRLLMEQELKPAQGDRFQPTGFADLGAAVYERHDGTRMLLVESAQSVANRMEAACLEGAGPQITSALKGLPYVLVKLNGAVETATSSLVEAHRINSPFIISNDEFKRSLVERAEYQKGKPLNWTKIATAIFAVDPNSLLHGVFMANLEDGRIKLPRVIAGFIEAEDIREAVSGGVKNNPLDPTGTIRAANYDKNVYSNVPYSRMEFTARTITAYFSLDLALVAGYGLDREARELIIALGLYKLRRFLNAGLRLRTACDFRPEGTLRVTSPTGYQIPGESELLSTVQKLIATCTEKRLFAAPAITEIETRCVIKAEKSEAAAGAAG